MIGAGSAMDSRVPAMGLRAGLTLVALLALLAVGASSAFASKGVVGFFGQQGSAGGEFSSPAGVAVNESSGDVYVVDSGGQRVQQFDADGVFVRAWGKDVVQAGGAGDVPTPPIVVNERQNVAIDGPFTLPCFCFAPITGGSFTLSFDGETTAAIPFDATAGQVETALEDLANIDSVTVTGGPGPDTDWLVEFDGPLSGTDVSDLSVDAAGLEPAGSSGFAFAQENGSTTSTGPAEVCTVAATCKTAATGSGEGEFSFGGSPQIAVDQSDGSVYVADNGNHRVQRFDANGVFVDEFGVNGSGQGELANPQGVAVDAVSGDVYVADTDNQRVQRFDDSGGFLDEIGTPGGGSGNGDFFGPTRVAVDSTGRVYVLDNGNGRVQRFTDTGSFDQVFAAGSYNSPVDLAVDQANDHVHIAASSADFSVSGIFEFDGDGNGIDTHAANAGIAPAGLDLRSSTGRIYVSDQPDNRVMILDQVNPPTATVQPPTDITTDGATLNGIVNPQGPPDTGYHFEYSIDGNTWSCVSSCSDTDVGQGTDDIPVSQPVEGLEVSTEYRVRLVATKTFNAGSTTSDETTFTTDPVAPLVRAIRAGKGTETTRWIGGEVNPRNSPTAVYVEYTLATDAAYADSQRLPLAPDTVDVGDGNAFVKVNQQATGLQPDTEYRYRLVADSEGGTTEGLDRTFTTTTTDLPEPPAGRGYEMVSPLDKNGAEIERNVYPANQATSGAAALGGKLAFAAVGQFAGIASGAPVGQYLSVRNAAAQRWDTRGVTPPTTPQPNDTTNNSEVRAFSEDLSRAVVGSTFPLVEGASLLGGRRGLYLQDLTGDEMTYDLLSKPVDQMTPFPVGNIWFDFVGASSDMRHVVFDSVLQLTTDGVPDGTRGVYEWADGQLRFVSPLPSGEYASGGGNPPSAEGFFHVGEHPVSDDGRRVFFTASPDAGTGQGTLYVREDGQATRLMSDSERVEDNEGEDEPEPDPQPGIFRAARASDGRMVLFTSEEKLTDDATATTDGGGRGDLYLWDADAPVGHRLTDLTVSDPDGGGVLNVVRAAEDLSRVYFAATGDLADGAVDGVPNLYAWTPDGGVRHVAVLDALRDMRLWGTQRSYGDDQFRSARVDGGGSRLLFESYAAPTADATGGSRQVYLYDYDADRLLCVSCPQDGSSADSDSWLFFPPDLGPAPYTDQPRIPFRLPRNLSVDGERAFFETAQKLVAGDTNGKPDVYMWSGGGLSLISTGKGGGGGSLFIDASASGDDVFFSTRERLVGVDTDNQMDVYDARVGGGFPEQQVAPPCVGDECQGQFGRPPSSAGPGSVLLERSDARPVRASLAVGRLSARQRRVLAAGGRASLAVSVNRPGRVSVRASARLKGRTETVARAAVSARRAGRVRLRLRLSRPARRALTGGAASLRVRLVVRFAGVVEESTVSLVGRMSERGER